MQKIYLLEDRQYVYDHYINQSKLISTNKVFGNDKFSFKMIHIQGGFFQMGEPKEKGLIYYSDRVMHAVFLDDYYICETPVTQELWTSVMGKNPSRFKGLTLPVESVSYYDCLQFIDVLNAQTGEKFRLPTEAEWEYAARGGCESRGFIYSGSNSIELVAWYGNGYHGSAYLQSTAPVKKYAPNELLLFDMSGNVYEWCQDRYAPYSDNKAWNPNGPISGKEKIARGGNWYNKELYCRVSYRASFDPSERKSIVGLRLAI